MQHNLTLNDDAAATVSAALADIVRALDNASATVQGLVERVPAREYDAVRANLGTIRDAQWRIDQIVFNTAPDDSEYGTDPALEALLDEEDAIIAARNVRDALLVRLERGLITVQEFQLALDPNGIRQAHPCSQPGCTHTVQFDDEPFCYTHSPDEGSSARGYSWMLTNKAVLPK